MPDTTEGPRATATRYVLPAEAGDALRSLLGGLAFPPGWTWSGAKLDHHLAEVGLFHAASATRGALTLVHKDAGLPEFADSPRAGTFAYRLTVDDAPLAEAVRNALEATGSGFPWLELSPSPAKSEAPRPPPMEPAGSTDAIGDLLALVGLSAPTPASTMSVPEAEVARASADAIAIDDLLELQPFLDTGIRVDPAPMLAEARAILDRYVAYQSDPSFKIEHWKGIGLWAFQGNERTIAMPNGFGSDDPGRYRRTAAADLCPETMKFLEAHFDLANARTITLLALSPRSEITPHSDDAMHEVAHSVNVALNMPAGCAFHIELADDGRPGPFTQVIPMQPGQAFLVNVGKEHGVKNDSDELRIHLVARAPLKRPLSGFVAQLREMTGLSDAAAVQDAIARRYAAAGWNPPAPRLAGARRPRHTVKGS